MESEENLSREKQNSKQNISVENSSSSKDTRQKPLEKQAKSQSFISPDNNQKVSTPQSLIDLALKDLQISREQLEKEIEELSKKKIQIDNELKSSFTGQSDAIARKVKGFQEYLTGALQDLAQSAEQLELVVPPVVVKA